MAVKTKTKTIRGDGRTLQVKAFKKFSVGITSVERTSDGHRPESVELRKATDGIWGSWSTTNSKSLSWIQTVFWGSVGIRMPSRDSSYYRVDYTLRTGSDA